MLIVFLNALAGFVAGEMPLAGLGAGKPDTEVFCGFDWPEDKRDGSADDVERVEVSGPGRSELPEPLRERDGLLGPLTEELRVLATGKEGRGPFGGRGMVVVVIVAIVGELKRRMATSAKDDQYESGSDQSQMFGKRLEHWPESRGEGELKRRQAVATPRSHAKRCLPTVACGRKALGEARGKGGSRGMLDVSLMVLDVVGETRTGKSTRQKGSCEGWIKVRRFGRRFKSSWLLRAEAT